MLVFTSKHISKIEGKVEANLQDVDPSSWPELYKITVREAYADIRLQIEEWVAQIPQDNPRRERLIRGLQQETLFRDAYNELVIGDKLRKSGYQIEYEKLIPGLAKDRTPDWYVEAKNETPAFYVEVYTPNPTDKIERNEYNWRDLRNRIEKIQLGFGLKIITEKTCIEPQTAGEKKKITTAISTWLKTKNPVEGERLYLECGTWEVVGADATAYSSGITIEVYDKFPKLEKPQVSCIGPINIHLLETDYVKRPIEEKVSKYGRVLDKLGVPFILWVLPQSEALLDGQSADDILYGQLVTEYFSDHQEPLWRRKKEEGLFTKSKQIHPSLSAIVWVSPWYDKNPSECLRIYPNPNRFDWLPLDRLNLAW